MGINGCKWIIAARGVWARSLQLDGECDRGKQGKLLPGFAQYPPDHPQRKAELRILAAFFLKTVVKQKDNLGATVKKEQALRLLLPALSRQTLELAKTRGEITLKEIEESAGANRNTIKVRLRKPASDNYLAQGGKGRGARYTLN
jgi:hypothetical protein